METIRGSTEQTFICLSPKVPPLQSPKAQWKPLDFQIGGYWSVLLHLFYHWVTFDLHFVWLLLSSRGKSQPPDCPYMLRLKESPIIPFFF